jgi:transposase InsO family protein
MICAAASVEHFACARRTPRHAYPIAPNILERDFAATAPDQKWLADMTYVPTAEGWLYLALVLDLFARKIVGWAMSETMPQELTIEALQVHWVGETRPWAWSIIQTEVRNMRPRTTARC